MSRCVKDGLWELPVADDLYFDTNNTNQPNYPSVYAQGVIYQRRADNGNTLLYYHDTHNQIPLIDEDLSIGISVNNDYGGRAYWLHKDAVIYSLQKTHALYTQSVFDKQQRKAIPFPRKIHYSFAHGSIVECAKKEYLVGILQEDKANDIHALRVISACDLATHEWITLDQGADFYAYIVYDTTHQRLAWVQWDHPNMPWDDTQLWVADVNVKNGKIELGNKRQVMPKKNANFAQLCFSQKGDLYFSADIKKSEQNPENYANIYMVNPKKINEVLTITREKCEFSYPHWQFGDNRIAMFDARYLLSIGAHPEQDILYLIDTIDKSIKSIPSKMGVNFSQLHAQDATAVMLHTDTTKAASILRYKGDFCDQQDVIATTPVQMPKDCISVGEHIDYQNTQRKPVFGFYYAPKNSQFQLKKLPPLLVMMHGGPTAHAQAGFDTQKQFWTQQGFAIFDVNYRGSTGYGRVYREALNGSWGEGDIDDMVCGVRYLIAQKKADPTRIVIRGKSAGGYSVLRALTCHPDLFAAASCYYGIADLATLAKCTHEFEKYYTNTLIGEDFDERTALLPSSNYYQRSPLYFLHKIKTPLLLFQGAKDPVVPVSLAKNLVCELEKKQIMHQYIEYPTEGHGFKLAENIIDAHQRERHFYKKVFHNG